MWRIWLAALFWGLNWPAVKVLLGGASPWTLRAAGLTGGTLLLVVATFASRRSFAVPRADWWKLVVAGLLNVAAFNIFAVFAQMSMTASRAAIITYTMPLWSVLFARFALAEPIDGFRAAAMTLGAGGIVLLAKPFWGTIASGGVPIGLVYVLLAAVTWAAGTVFVKWSAPRGDPLSLTTWQFAVGAVATVIGMCLLETPRLDLSDPVRQAAFAFHVIFPQAVAYALWFALMARVPASTAALGTLLVPVVAVTASSLWIGERLSPLDWLGFAMILGALALDQGLARRWRPGR